MTAHGGIMGIVLLDQVGYGSAMKLLFEVKELLKIESPGNGEEADVRNAIRMVKLDSG